MKIPLSNYYNEYVGSRPKKIIFRITVSFLAFFVYVLLTPPSKNKITPSTPSPSQTSEVKGIEITSAPIVLLKRTDQFYRIVVDLNCD
ncbi:MAG: hypothetical protein FJ044_02060 [Candidatus Cloacimonetes bacterium]|nr:hypothetical protein [Candidatus Cloacimonadota bacterium]